jgi:Luciferase-like monooxygenase
MTQSRMLRAGVFLPPFHPNDEDPLLCMERDFELMQRLEKHDYDEAWVGEYHSGGYEIYGQPELFIATSAERTRRIRLGTGVISLLYHHPFMVADWIVQLDTRRAAARCSASVPDCSPRTLECSALSPRRSATEWRMRSTSSLGSSRARSSRGTASGTRCARGGCNCAPKRRSQIK